MRNIINVISEGMKRVNVEDLKRALSQEEENEIISIDGYNMVKLLMGYIVLLCARIILNSIKLSGHLVVLNFINMIVLMIVVTISRKSKMNCTRKKMSLFVAMLVFVITLRVMESVSGIIGFTISFNIITLIEAIVSICFGFIELSLLGNMISNGGFEDDSQGTEK